MADGTRTSVVLHFRNKHTERCTLTKDFSPGGDVIEAVNADGDPVRVEIDDLKAVFFLKDPRMRGAELHVGEREEDLPASAASRAGSAVARAEFFDGEIVRGRAQHYSLANKGFYLYPMSLDSNNERIFVVAKALLAIDIES